MLHRLTFYVLMIVLFALTQIGAMTHEISHYNSQHNQQDQHTAPDQCSQCITIAHASAGVLAQAVVLAGSLAEFQLVPFYLAKTTSTLSVAYSARAPPITLI